MPSLPYEHAFAGVDALSQRIVSNVQTVEVHEGKCALLGRRCVQIAAELRNISEGLVGTLVQQAVDKSCRILHRIEQRSAEWPHVSDERFVEELGDFNHELDSSMMLFADSLLQELKRTDVVQFQSLVQLMYSQGETHQGLLRQISRRQMAASDMERLMVIAQETLCQQHLEPDAQEVLEEGLYSIFKQSGPPFPLLDLRGCIKKLETEPIAGGSCSEVYIALLLGREKVAMKSFRAFKATEAGVKRFEREVRIWRDLKHDNVLPCFGLVTQLGPVITLVVPWMGNGDVMSHIATFREFDRQKTIIETARGLAYLHRNNIVHGDLRGSNILIGNKGEARLCDFGLVDVPSDPSWSVCNGASKSRWLSPEIMCGKTGPTSASDVFSFGRTILEILTGCRPFMSIRNSFQVVSDVCNGVEPERPEDPEATLRGLNDEMWLFLRTTWNRSSKLRPTTAVCVSKAERLLQTSSSPSTPLLASPMPCGF